MTAYMGVLFYTALVLFSGLGYSALIGKSHSGGRDNQILQYVVNNSLREHPVLTKLKLRTLEDSWSRMMVAAEEAQFMANLIRLINGTKAIEIVGGVTKTFTQLKVHCTIFLVEGPLPACLHGDFIATLGMFHGLYTGYNALSMALAMPDNGRVVGCEIDQTYYDIAKPFFKEAGVEHKIEVRIQEAVKTLDELIQAGESGTYDFVFIDADKINYDTYYEKSLELIRTNGVIAIDNVLWSGRVLNPAEDDVSSKALDALNKKLHKDERINLSMLTVADGLTIAIKKPLQ